MTWRGSQLLSLKTSTVRAKAKTPRERFREQGTDGK
jgi:hypothetical protein